jgi:hypothetical protein
VFTIANKLVHQPGEGVLQTDLQTILVNLGDMHGPTLRIEEDMEFPRGLSVKKILEFVSLLNL